MTKTVRLLISIVLVGLAASNDADAQREKPVKWHFAAVPINEKEAKLIFTANLDDSWHIYSQFLEEGGPLPTTFTFVAGNNYTFKGKVKEESMPVKSYDHTFMIDIVWYRKTAVFSQDVSLSVPSVIIKGKIEFMMCTDDICLPPDEIEFSLEVKTVNSENSKGK